MKEAKSIPIINQLLKEGTNITAYDPVAISNAKSIFGDKIKYAPSAIECPKKRRLLHHHNRVGCIQKLKPEDFTKNMRQPIVIDGRRIY